MNRSLSLIIKGRVQGVGFRYHSLNKANELGVHGFVRNQPDGSVYIEAEGDEGLLGEFEEWCRQGPRWATVSSVEVIPIESRGYSEFIVK